MDGMLQPADVTAFDATASILSLAVYLAAAIVTIARAPRDARARTFLAVALTSAVVYALSPLQWWKGTGVYTPAVIALAAATFTIGSIALFHFTQVFPARRPFITGHFAWVLTAYLVLPVPVAATAWGIAGLVTGFNDTGAGGLGAVSLGVGVLLLALVVLLVLVVGVLLPLGGVLSLVKSWREATAGARQRDASATFWMLVSQLGGGVLTILVLPVLGLSGVGPPWLNVIAALSYAFALLLPIAFVRFTFSTSAG
jgi:hypothetical protein